MPPVDSDFGKWIITLGVGGILALIMFFIHRKDAQQYAATLKSIGEQHSSTLAAQSNQLAKVADTLMMVLKENTAAHVANTSSNVQLVTTVSALHRRVDIDNIEQAKTKALMITEVIQELCRPGSVFLQALMAGRRDRTE